MNTTIDKLASAFFAKVSSADIRNGDDDGFVYDGTEQERPVSTKADDWLHSHSHSHSQTQHRISPHPVGRSVSASQSPETPDDDPPWLYAELPDDTIKLIRGWQKTIIDSGQAVKNLHITLLHHVTDEDPLPAVSDVWRDGDECRVSIGSLRCFHTEKGDAIVLQVDSRSLDDVQRAIRQRVSNVASAYQFTAHITLGYLPAGEGDLYDGLWIPGLTNVVFLIDTLVLDTRGTKRKIRAGDTVAKAKPKVLSTDMKKSLSDDLDRIAEKAMGMSTMTGAGGGYLVDSDDTEDEEDDPWFGKNLLFN